MNMVMSLVLVFIGTLFSLDAHAGLQIYNGTTRVGQVDTLKCSTGTSCTKVGAVATITKSSLGLQTQVASTTTTITAAQCGSSFISNSADVMTLPEASTVLGCRLTFICGTADDFDVNPNGASDQISVMNSVAGGKGSAITPSAGDAIRCTDIGSSVMLEAIAADRWVAVGVGNGAWTDVN
jgi:hypothetical protein